MAETPTEKKRAVRVDDVSPGPNPEFIRKARKVAWVVVAVLVAGAAWLVFREINAGNKAARWDDLYRLEHKFRQGSSTRGWLAATDSPTEVRLRDEQIKALEDFLAKNEEDPTIAAHLHGTIADLYLTKALGLLAGGATQSIVPDLDAAKKHLETLRERYPDAPVNWSTFATREASSREPGAPKPASSVVSMVLQRIESLRTWETQHGWKDVEPDADPVVVLRTTAGDLHLRLYASASPVLAKRFLERACAGSLVGVRLFQREGPISAETADTWVRAGGERSKGDKTTEEDRIAWLEPSPGEAVVADRGRFVVAHKIGVVSAWHASADSDDDPEQFFFETKDDPSLNFEYTPFARVEPGASTVVLQNIAASKTYVRDEPDIRSDSKRTRLADQLVTPVVVKRVLVFEKGALKCPEASKVDAEETTLEKLKAKPDAFLEKPPPAPAANPPGANPPAMDGAGMDGAGMDDAAAMDSDAMNGGTPPK